MNTAKKAEEYIKQYFNDKLNIKLIKYQKGERGFDFRNSKSTIFVEVKGTAKKKLSDILFRLFSKSQYEKAQECLCDNKRYEIHLVTAVGKPGQEHYRIPAKVFVTRAKPAISWSLPITKEIAKYKVKCPG